mmetsp:Transcript_25953/g.43770  ORF Transcript_25953/g.43770 Transcript_25953/m.43770 type:complete len:337 (+) Transcript_25953:96-1106(+)
MAVIVWGFFHRMLCVIMFIVARSGMTASSASRKQDLAFIVPIPRSTCGVNKKKQSSVPASTRINMLLDEKHKVIMDWTPKAACTKVVEMFWNEMGITRGLFYPENAFIHNYRTQFYYNCGTVSQDMLDSHQYYKFKVVRNPFNRAVSSYIHIMRHHIAHTLLHGLSRQAANEERNQRLDKEYALRHPWNDLSFEGFLELYVTSMDKIHHQQNSHSVAVKHVQSQSSDDEVKAFHQKRPSMFNHIVHMESFEADIAVVNAATGRNYSFPAGEDPHVVAKIEVNETFQGDKAFHYFMENGIPANYGKFYNRRTKQLIQKIFINDLKLYNYSFPFERYY